MPLIDTEEFKHKLNNSKYYGTEAWDDICNMLYECKSKTLKTEDNAVPVVRCKNCEYFLEFEKPVVLKPWEGFCKYNNHSVMKKDFCSRGKEK